MSEKSWKEVHNFQVAKVLAHLRDATNALDQAEALLATLDEPTLATAMREAGVNIIEHSKAVRGLLCY